MSGQPPRRVAPRAAVELPVTLMRGRGNPIVSRTVDVGVGGMRVFCERPLAVDELVAFDLECPGARVGGRARVLREHVGTTYALRFEGLAAESSDVLRQLYDGRMTEPS